MSLNLTALAEKPKKKGGKVYPYLPDPTGEIATLVDQAKSLHDEIAQRNAGLEVRKSKLKAVAVEYALRSQNMAADVATTFKAKGTTAEATVAMPNKYRLPENLAPLRAALGEHADRFIRERYEITIDTGKIPEHLQQAFVDCIVETATAMQVLDAVTAEKVVGLSQAFHQERHQVMTTEQNLAIEKIIPMSPSVRIG